MRAWRMMIASIGDGASRSMRSMEGRGPCRRWRPSPAGCDVRHLSPRATGPVPACLQRVHWRGGCSDVAPEVGSEPTTFQFTSRMSGVGPDGSRRIWPAHVGWPVGPDGSRRIQKDRLGDQTDGQGASDTRSDLATVAARRRGGDSTVPRGIPLNVGSAAGGLVVPGRMLGWWFGILEEPDAGWWCGPGWWRLTPPVRPGPLLPGNAAGR
jgi:hypothetical protein